MPWKETCPMNERVKFIGLWLQDESSLAALCRDFGISRKTGYKWVERFTAEDLHGLENRSRAFLKLILLRLGLELLNRPDCFSC